MNISNKFLAHISLNFAFPKLLAAPTVAAVHVQKSFFVRGRTQTPAYSRLSLTPVSKANIVANAGTAANFGNAGFAMSSASQTSLEFAVLSMFASSPAFVALFAPVELGTS